MYNHKDDLSKGLEHIRKAANCFDTAKGSTKLGGSERKKLDKVLNNLGCADKMTGRLLKK